MKPILIGLCIIVPFLFLLSTPYFPIVVGTLLLMAVSWVIGEFVITAYNDYITED